MIRVVRNINILKHSWRFCDFKAIDLLPVENGHINNQTCRSQFFLSPQRNFGKKFHTSLPGSAPYKLRLFFPSKLKIVGILSQFLAQGLQFIGPLFCKRTGLQLRVAKNHN